MSYIFKRTHGIWYAAVSVVRTIKDLEPSSTKKPRYAWKIVSLKTTNLQEAKERFANLLFQQKPILIPQQTELPYITTSSCETQGIKLKDYFNSV